MDIIVKIRSFWGVAAGVLLLSALLGLAIGFMGSAPSAIPHSGDAGSNPGIKRIDDAGLALKAPDTTSSREPAASLVNSGNKPIVEKTDPVKPQVVKSRVLPEGRFDQLVQLKRTSQASGVVIVTATDSQGETMPGVLLRLYVNTGPMGWQALMQQALPRGNGVYEFRRLFSGDYQIRSQETGEHTCKPTDLTLYANDTTVEVKLVVTPNRFGNIDFYIHYEDGIVPKTISIQSTSGDLNAGTLEGRFKKYNKGAILNGELRSRQRHHTPNATTGIVPQSVKLGSESRFRFVANREGQDYEAEYLFNDTEEPNQQIEIVLRGKANNAEDADKAPVGVANKNLEITLSINGNSDARFTGVNLRRTLDDVDNRPPQRIEGNTYNFQNLQAGVWIVVAKAEAYHAAFVQKITVGTQQVQAIDIRTSKLRVTVNAGVSPNSRNSNFKIRFRPFDSGNIEHVYAAKMDGKTSTFMDYILPTGQFHVWMDDGDATKPVSFTPEKQQLLVENGIQQNLTFEVNSAAQLLFRCVNSSGDPVAYPEFIVSFHAAGKVPVADKEKTGAGNSTGKCVFSNAPWGEVYLMVWTSSKNWDDPDLVLKVNLPAGGQLDLGNVVVP